MVKNSSDAEWFGIQVAFKIKPFKSNRAIPLKTDQNGRHLVKYHSKTELLKQVVIKQILNLKVLYLGPAVLELTFLNYSEDLNTRQVWYSNGQICLIAKWSSNQMSFEKRTKFS